MLKKLLKEFANYLNAIQDYVSAEKLYEKALEYANISENDVVLDCYCGVGTISLLAAQKAKKVYGIEIVPEAINDAIKNYVNVDREDECQFYTLDNWGYDSNIGFYPKPLFPNL